MDSILATAKRFDAKTDPCDHLSMVPPIVKLRQERLMVCVLCVCVCMCACVCLRARPCVRQGEPGIVSLLHALGCRHRHRSDASAATLAIALRYPRCRIVGPPSSQAKMSPRFTEKPLVAPQTSPQRKIFDFLRKLIKTLRELSVLDRKMDLQRLFQVGDDSDGDGDGGGDGVRV